MGGPTAMTADSPSSLKDHPLRTSEYRLNLARQWSDGIGLMVSKPKSKVKTMVFFAKLKLQFLTEHMIQLTCCMLRQMSWCITDADMASCYGTGNVLQATLWPMSAVCYGCQHGRHWHFVVTDHSTHMYIGIETNMKPLVSVNYQNWTKFSP